MGTFGARIPAEFAPDQNPWLGCVCTFVQRSSSSRPWCVWYSKQLLLSTLGVAVAEEARNRGAKVQNIEVANSIEALACWLALNGNGWSRDTRLRGNSKLQGKDDFSFRRVRQRNFYVTQPMRMATVQPLPALGFVETDSARFVSVPRTLTC